MTEMRRTELQYSKVIQASIDGFCVNDIDGRFLEVNDAYCDLTGYCREELLDMRMADIEVVEKPEETAPRIRKIIKSGSERFVTRHRRKNGSIVDVEISINFVRAPKDLFFMFIRDITDRQQTEEGLLLEEETFRTIVENSPS